MSHYLTAAAQKSRKLRFQERERRRHHTAERSMAREMIPAERRQRSREVQSGAIFRKISPRRRIAGRPVPGRLPSEHRAGALPTHWTEPEALSSELDGVIPALGLPHLANPGRPRPKSLHPRVERAAGGIIDVLPGEMVLTEDDPLPEWFVPLYRGGGR